MSVLVVTDGAAAVPADLALDLGVEVVPIWVAIDGRDYRDGDIPIDELLAHDPAGLSTAGPTPGDYVEAIERHPDCDEVLIVTVAHDLSRGSFGSARAAKGLLDLPTRVLDSRTAAGGQGLVALAAGAAARQARSLSEVEATAQQVVKRVRLLATLPNLDHLARSGHVPEAGAWAARFVGLHVVVELRAATVRPLRPALSEGAAMDHILHSWRNSAPSRPARLHVAALHALAPEPAARLLAAVRSEVEPATAFVGSFGTGMIVHSGPGVIGMAWWWDEAES